MYAKITIKYTRPRVIKMPLDFYRNCCYDALNAGIKRCSVPDRVLVDNGKEIVPVGKAVKPVYVTEYCSCCEHEVTIQWNIGTDGFRAYCPYCGERLMLCDECRHSELDKNGCADDVCDYDSGTDSCKHNKEVLR